MSSAEVVQAYKDSQLLVLLGILMCIFWLANYVAMVYQSFQDHTYSMALMPLCCNIAWEFVFFAIYPMDIPIWRYILASWFFLDCAVAFATIKFAPNEWENAPLVQKNLPWIFTFSVVGWMTVHLALIAQFGTLDGVAWSAGFCSILISTTSLCQLIVRGNSRGTSFFIWFTRFVGTVFALPHEVLRHQHGYGRVAWHCPVGWWGGLAFFLLDGVYGMILWRFQQSERGVYDLRQEKAGSKKLEKGKVEVQKGC